MMWWIRSNSVQILENTNLWGWLSITSEHSWLFSYSITSCRCSTVLNWCLTLEFKISTQFILDEYYLCLLLLFLWLPQWTSQQSPGVWKPLKYRGEKQQQIKFDEKWLVLFFLLICCRRHVQNHRTESAADLVHSSWLSKRRATGFSGALSYGPSERNEALADRRTRCPEPAAWGCRAKDRAAACPGHCTWKKSSPAS